jgi:hypothetical protein
LKKNESIIIKLLLLTFLSSIIPIKVRALDFNKSTENKYNIVIEIGEKKLFLIDKNTKQVIKSYRIACGKVDTPSPLGTWTVISKGEWSGGFGTRWLGLNVPWGLYGIHGTNRPGSISSAASHGCIRMFNNDIEDLYKYVNVGTTVVIQCELYGAYNGGYRYLKPGDRGADVLEVQRLLKAKGYYSGSIDGVYGDGMKAGIIQFREENNLKTSHDIDYKFYKKIGMDLFD